jgi:hypothetical protein
MSKLYGWTPRQISDLTYPQLLMYLQADGPQEKENGVIAFNTMRELDAWRKQKGFG